MVTNNKNELIANFSKSHKPSHENILLVTLKY